MANTYKTIGSSAAAVVSLLAIGTLCWWQRTPGPINAPRPQDSAEVMTAILEKHYAMKRPWVGYWAGYGEVTANVFITNAPAVMAGGNLGAYWLFEQGSGRRVDWSPSRKHPWTSAGIFVYDESGEQDFIVEIVGGDFVGRFVGDPGPSYTAAYWYGNGTNLPQWLTPDENGYGSMYLYQAPVGAMAGVHGIVTNSVAYTTTNTIGFFPNAPFRLASGIRSAFFAGDTTDEFPGWGWDRDGNINLQVWYVPGIGIQRYAPPQMLSISLDVPSCLGVNRDVGWIIPEDAYMQTGDTSWFGTMVHTNIFGGPLNYWLRWYQEDDGIYGATWEEFANTFFSRSQFVWTNYVSKCDSTWSTTTNYATSCVTNRVVGVVTNTITNTTFSTTNYVSTRTLNTYASEGEGREEFPWMTACISMMFPFERDTPGITRVDANGSAGFDGAPAGKYHPAFWSTNVYRDMGRALSLLQWIREYQTPCELVTWTGVYTNGIFSSLTVATNFSAGVAGVSGSSGTPRRITVVGTVAKYAITNDRPFTIDHVHFTPDAISFTNGITAATWGSNPPPISVVAPYESATTDWWPMTPDEMRTWVDDTAAGIEYGVDPLPGMSISMPCVSFHVQFSALTNYLDHAPAR